MRGAGPKLIAFSGMDGVGKSQHARALVEDLSRGGRRAVYRRLRFPFVLSLPVLLYARLRGWSYDVRAGGQTLRVHGFAASPLVRFLYPLTLFLDLLLATWILVRLPIAFGRTVVCDRFVMDSRIDAASSCRREIASGSPLALLYQALVPPGAQTFLLTASRETLQRRRVESSAEPTFGLRSQLYERAAETEDAHVVDSGRGFEQVHDEIHAVLTAKWQHWETPEPRRTLSRRWYAHVEKTALPSALGKALLLLTHWVFQSVGAMGWTERVFKAAIGMAVFLPGFLILLGPFGPLFAAVVALLIAHTANFLLNAHLPVVLKHLGFQVGVARIRRYAEGLQRRMQGRPQLQGVVIVGSLARSESRPGSDLDVRLVPRPGLKNALRAANLAFLERTQALVRKFPLDIYVAEGAGALEGLRESKNPIVLCDNTGSFGASLARLQARGSRE